MKKLSIELDELQAKELKAKLALEGKTLSQWFRERVKEELKEFKTFRDTELQS